MYCIGFNGPPRSGKDTIVRLLADRFDHPPALLPVIPCALSMPMRLVAFAMLGRPYSVEEYEEIKDRPQPVFNGETLRRFMIRYSEEFAKPTYGKQVWGASLCAGLGTSIDLPGLCLISDIGFQEETDYLEDRFGPDRFILIQLIRAGKTWEGDSRGYVKAERTIRFANPEGRASHVADLVLEMAHIEGWEL